MIQCTTSEMSAVLKCSPDTLERRFAAIIKNGREYGKMSIKRMQYKKAMEGNVGMLIWLGKQLLGQREPRDIAPLVSTTEDNKLIIQFEKNETDK